MYTARMERNMQKIGYNINKFRGNLLLLKGGKDPEDLKCEFLEIKRALEDIYRDIKRETPDYGLEEIHLKILEASKTYTESLEEFMKFYDDHDDEHFVHAGLKINEANELINQATALF